VTALDGSGQAGTGTVIVTSSHGSLVDSDNVMLDSTGSGTEPFTCAVATDPLCSGRVRVVGEWHTAGQVAYAEVDFNVFDPNVVPDTVFPVTDQSTFWVNSHIGTMLNGTQPDFPDNMGDPTLKPADEPDLSPVSSILGDWLVAGPPPANGDWAMVAAYTKMWPVGTEVAMVIPITINAGGHLVASIGVDNGVFVWLDGVYTFGAEEPGPATPGEYMVDLGTLQGTHYLQFLLEDHGGTNGFSLSITKR